jgi:hypothetical protein
VLQDVFDRSIGRMAREGWSDDEIDQLRSASLHWLRHISATFDAPHRGGSKLYGREVCLPWVLKPFSAGWLM